MPEQQQRPKMVMELASGRPSFDVTHYSLHVSKRVIGSGQWLVDMRTYLADKTLTAPDYDWADMSPGALRAATQPDGRIDSLPLETDIWLLYYNRQLLADRGLTLPKTFDEMLATARKATDASKGIYGFVARGVKNANVPVWTSILLGQDQETVSPDGKTLLTDTPGAIWAGQMYKDLQREAAPPGVVGFNWNECQTSFMQGKVAMWLDGVGFAPPLLDPKVSKIVDHVGFGLMPAGPKGHFCPVFTDGLGIPVKSQAKEAAYLYCQWATTQADADQPGEHGRWRLAAAFHLSGSRAGREQSVRQGVARHSDGEHENRPSWPAGNHSGHRIPRRHWHCTGQHDWRC